MLRTKSKLRIALLPAASLALLYAQQHSNVAPQTDSSFIDANGTAHVTRVVPVPSTVSPEAQKSLARQVLDQAAPETIAQRRSKTDEWQNRTGRQFRALYPVDIAEQKIAGVPVRIITPANMPETNSNRVFINVHGGGFNSDSGSFTESIPIAHFARTRVIAVLYRLAPEHPFPAALDDTVAVYKELLKTYKPENMALYGTSAGAILTAEVAARLKLSKLPLPAALGIFSGFGDFTRSGDSQAMYALGGLSGPLSPPSATGPDQEYVTSTDRHDPVLSPLFSDLKGLPPTLFVTSGRDLLLSGTTILHRAFLRAGVDAQLVVFEALPHAFWNNPALPESTEANQLMASFFDKHVGRKSGSELFRTSQ